jgi:hypothetical protein
MENRLNGYLGEGIYALKYFKIIKQTYSIINYFQIKNSLFK